MPQGLAALLVKGLSGCAPEEIVGVEASSVIEALGLSASLTPSRNNGFLNMFRLMQKKALGFLTQVHPMPTSRRRSNPELAPRRKPETIVVSHHILKAASGMSLRMPEAESC